MHAARGAIGTQQIDHLLIAIRQGHAERVCRAFHLHIRVRPAFEQQFRDFVMSVVDGRIQRVTARRDSLLGQVRIGAAFEQQPDDFHVPLRRRVFQGRAAAQVIRTVVRDPIGQRRILIQKLSYAVQISDVGRRPDVDVGATNSQMGEHLRGRCLDILRHVTPAAIVVIAIA